MPRSNWKGHISFGLVNIPIILINSENNSEKVSFHQMDKRNQARIKYQRVNSETGDEVPWENIIKGYQYAKDIILPVDEGELKKVVGENARTIAIENFVNKDSINFIDISKTYYLLPGKNAEKGYVLLREALKKTNKIGIAKIIISTKEYLSAVAFYKNALVLYILRYAEEIKPLAELGLPTAELKTYKVNSKELDIATQLIKSMSTAWDPSKYYDEYQAAVHQWAENKVKKKHLKKMPLRVKGAPPGQKITFIELLKKSLNDTKKPKQTSTTAHLKKKSSHKRAAVH